VRNTLTRTPAKVGVGQSPVLTCLDRSNNSIRQWRNGFASSMGSHSQQPHTRPQLCILVRYTAAPRLRRYGCSVAGYRCPFVLQHALQAPSGVITGSISVPVCLAILPEVVLSPSDPKRTFLSYGWDWFVAWLPLLLSPVKTLELLTYPPVSFPDC
jgi:hypothetical protein